MAWCVVKSTMLEDQNDYFVAAVYGPYSWESDAEVVATRYHAEDMNKNEYDNLYEVVEMQHDSWYDNLTWEV
jgi:hypothetical protein